MTTKEFWEKLFKESMYIKNKDDEIIFVGKFTHGKDLKDADLKESA